MDEITNLYTEANEKFACNNCNYKSKRFDNLKRHIDERHLNKKVKCLKCGKELTKSALSRHKRLACKKSQSKASKQSEAMTNNSQSQPDSIVSIEQRTIPLNVEITKLLDGKVIIKSDDIEIDGLVFQLTQKKGNPIFVANGRIKFN